MSQLNSTPEAARLSSLLHLTCLLFEVSSLLSNMCTKYMLVLKFAWKIKGVSFPVSFVLQEKKFQCEVIVEKFGILNSLLELLELCQANLVQIKLMGNTATTPVYVFFCVLNPLTPVAAVTGRDEG